MIQRFGRNKRRAAREALAVERARAEAANTILNDVRWQLQVAREVAKGREALLKEANAKLEKTRALMEEVGRAVRDVFGDHTVLLPPGSMATTEAHYVPDRLLMYRPQRTQVIPVRRLTDETHAREIVDMCTVLTAQGEIDHWARRQHVYIVNGREKLVAYSLDDKAAREMPKPLLAQRIAEAIAPLLIDKLKGRR